MDKAELFHYWNKRLKEEGLGVYKGGREILVPDLIENYPMLPKGGRKKISLPLEILSPRQREVVYLLFYDGLSEQEAAEKLGISRSSVRTHRGRALEKLKEELEKELVDGEEWGKIKARWEKT